MARIKAWLLARRNTTRDYLDLVVLCDRLGDGAAQALATLDALNAQLSQSSPLAEVIERLGVGAPMDLAEIDLRSYRGLVAPYDDWAEVRRRGREHATRLAAALLGGPP